jgi:hypothetical protein
MLDARLERNAKAWKGAVYTCAASAIDIFRDMPHCLERVRQRGTAQLSRWSRVVIGKEARQVGCHPANLFRYGNVGRIAVLTPEDTTSEGLAGKVGEDLCRTAQQRPALLSVIAEIRVVSKA